MLCPKARHFIRCLELFQRRKTGPDLNEKWLFFCDVKQNHLYPSVVYARSEGSGESTHKRIFA